MDVNSRDFWLCLGIHNSLYLIKTLATLCRSLNILYSSDEFWKAKFGCLRTSVLTEYTKYNTQLKPMSEEDKTMVFKNFPKDKAENFTYIKSQIQDFNNIRLTFKTIGKNIIKIGILCRNDYFYHFRRILKIETWVSDESPIQKVFIVPVIMGKNITRIDYVYDEETSTMQCFLNDLKYSEAHPLDIRKWFTKEGKDIASYKDSIEKQQIKSYLAYKVKNIDDGHSELYLTSSPQSHTYIENFIY